MISDKERREVARMLRMSRSESECGKGTFCEAPTIAAARISEELEVEL